MRLSTLLRPGVVTLALAVLAAQALAQEKTVKRPIDKFSYPKLHDLTSPTVVRETLPNGMKLLLIEDHDLPQVSFRALVRGGQVAEPRGKAGLVELFGETQRTGGTASMSGDDVDALLDRVGASIETTVNEAYGVVSGKTLTENVDKVLPVYADFLTAPAFAQDKIDLAKTHLRGRIARRNDQVFGIAGREFNKLIYGAKSPYARQYEYDDVDALSREDLVAFHARYYRPDATILAVWGDFKTADMKAKLAAALGGWKAAGAAPKITLPVVAPQVPSLNYIEKKDVEQTYIIAGQLGLRTDDPDYPAIYVMSDILGGGFASRIFVKVRTEKGLAYSAGGRMIPAYDHLGAFYFFTSTKPSTTAEALAAVLDEIKKIRAAPVTDDELKRAKDGYLNGYAFEYDSTAKIIDRLASYDFYGYPADFNVKLRDAIEKVTKDDVLRTAKKYLRPEELTILAIGRADQFDKPLATFGKVNTIDITIPEPKPKETIAEATPESLARGKELLFKVAKAVGEPALRALRDITSEGVTTAKTPMGAMELKGKATFVLPNRLYNEVTTPMGTMLQVLDGEKAWMQMGGRSRDLPESAAAEMRRTLYTVAGCAMVVRDVLEGRLQAQAAGKVKFEGKDAEDVLVRLGDKPVHIYLAPDASEIIGVRRTTQTQQGPAEVVELFGGYQVVSGLRLPFENTTKVKGEVQASTKLSGVKINAGFSEDLFKKPAAGEEK
jgi:predicted Zn-dependent peptidase